MKRDTFFVKEDVEISGDMGDNDYSYYEINIPVEPLDSANPIRTVLASKAQICLDENPKKHPVLKRYMGIKAGDELVIEYSSEQGVHGLLQDTEIISILKRSPCHCKNRLAVKREWYDDDRIVSCERVRGIPLEWLFSEMSNIAARNGICIQAADTWMHSTEVHRLAKEIAEKSSIDKILELMGKSAVSSGNHLADWIVEKACYIHDFGRMFTGSAASVQIADGALHGVYGAMYWRDQAERRMDSIDGYGRFWENSTEKHVLELFARVCERHMGGAGLTLSSILKNSQLEKYASSDLLAEYPYEKIVGYADWRIHPLKLGHSFIPTRVSEEDAFQRTMNYNPPNDQVEAVEKLCEYIHYITDNKVR